MSASRTIPCLPNCSPMFPFFSFSFFLCFLFSLLSFLSFLSFSFLLFLKTMKKIREQKLNNLNKFLNKPLLTPFAFTVRITAALTVTAAGAVGRAPSSLLVPPASCFNKNTNYWPTLASNVDLLLPVIVWIWFWIWRASVPLFDTTLVLCALFPNQFINQDCIGEGARMMHLFPFFCGGLISVPVWNGFFGLIGFLVLHTLTIVIIIFACLVWHVLPFGRQNKQKKQIMST